MSSNGDSEGSSLRVVCGPTAAGKSAIALWLAARHGAAIVSADSRQIYRGFDIGTAKPTPEERRAVPHFGVDVCAPTERYSAAAWAEAAERWIATAMAAGRTPLLVGGTGFYLQALFRPLFEQPELDPGRRAELAAMLGTLPTEKLRLWVERLDPERGHLGRAQLVRAVEIALLTGRRVSTLHRASVRRGRWRARYLLVDPGPALATRIADRVDAMLAGGWVEEALRLSRTVPAGAPAWKATGYAAMRSVALGEVMPARGRELAITGTRQYAKRQRTWFRHQLDGESVTRLDPGVPEWRTAVDRWWHGGEEV